MIAIARLLAIGLLTLLMIDATQAQGEDFSTGMDAYLRDAMHEWRVPGLAIAVVKDGQTVLARGYGNREMGRNSPVTTDTVFSIASCTKSFTAACIALLIADGKVQWDDPVRQHLPEFGVAILT